jgi:hemoglobin-like flavoprotein
MTPEEIDAVRTSYASIGRDGAAVAAEFYRRLFAADPSARAPFTQGPDVMASKFADELEAIVEAIVSYETFVTRVKDLAARHATYGVQTRHYRAAGDALLGALALRLGAAWDADTEAAWRRAYNLVAEIMMATSAAR